MPDLPCISHMLQHVRDRMARAAALAQRQPQDIRLLAVSKTFPATAVAEAAHAGQLAFGENYVQEGVEKICTLQGQGIGAIQWHCIGPLQSRKTALVARHFDWLQSLDRLDIAQRLSRQRPPERPALQVCLQVNMDGGANKSGLRPEQVLPFAQAVRELPQLQLRGLMSIPEPYADPQQTLAVHQRTRELFDTLGQSLDLPAGQWDTLSMGMSADLELAIAAGSTLVRVGTAIFGGRPAQGHAAAPAA